MKRLVWLLLSFLLLSSACHALGSERQAIPSLPVTQGGVAGSTEQGPSSTASPPALPDFTKMPAPAPEPITCSDDTCLDACLQRIEKALPQTEYEPLNGAYAANDTDLCLVYYDVRDGQLGEPYFLQVPDAFKAYQQDTVAQRALWKYASSLLPPDLLKWIDRFQISKSNIYGGSMMPSDPDRHDRSRWTLTMELGHVQNPMQASDTLVHEYGHLIMMNTDQIPASDFYYNWYQNPAICKQFLSPLGCSQPDSYINHFYQAFWKDILDEWLLDGGRSVTPNSPEARRLEEYFYNKHPDLFLTEHAAADIHEDMATSFESFVLTPKPAGNSILEQKILFFYDYPELVALRQQMIQRICSYTGQ